MASGSAQCGDKVLTSQYRYEAVHNAIHHNGICLFSPTLRSWPVEGVEHGRDTIVSVIVVEKHI